MSNSKKPYEKTREKIVNTPFSSVKELESMEKDIQLRNWRRLATYRDFKTQLQDDSNMDIRKDLETGVMCAYQDKGEKLEAGDSSILRVYKAKSGIQVMINEKRPADPKLVSSLASGMVHSFGLLYYEISGLKSSNLTELAENSKI